MRVRAAWPLIVAGAALLVTACGKAPVPKEEPPRPVRTVVVEPSARDDAVSWPAEIRPRIEIRYGFRVAGKLAERRVSVGDRVRSGQVLARLDPQDAAPAVAAAQASLDAMRVDVSLQAAELARVRELKERNFISQASLDRQQAAHDAALSRERAAAAQLVQARNAVEFQTLRADSDGIVVGVDAEAGQVVAAGQAVIRVAKAGEVEALVNVPERDVANARAARAWRVVVPAAGDRALEARVREISPVSDPASRTFPMRLTLSGHLAGVELGMSAVASAGGGAGDVVALPIAALYTQDAQSRVWVVDPATLTVRAVAVRTAGLAGDTVRIADGLKRGDRVVTAGANLLVAGQKVKLLEAPAGAAGAAPASNAAPPTK